MMTSRDDAAVASGITTEELARVSRTRVFFGHQSVGMNILDGVRSVYAAHGIAAPVIEEGGTEPGENGGFISHAFIGKNENYRLKIEDFDRTMRSGTGRLVDVAMMKFCYVDINAATDVGALFATYREVTAALQRDFPEVAFIHATVPLTTQPGLLSRLKGQLTGQSGWALNAARERLNALIRREYASDRLFDLAAAESTAPDGSRIGATFGEEQCYQLYGGYAADNGHLNREGAQVVATAWLNAIAHASRK
jgi:hypothetical protein